MKNVIVTDGLWRKSLSAVRSLGKAGYHVSVFGDSWATTAFWSRYTKRRIMCPVAKDNATAFGSELLQHLRSSATDDKPVLLPMEDATLEWVSEQRHLVLQYANVLLPPQESLAIAQSKFETGRTALALGLPVPATWAPDTAQELEERIRELASDGSHAGYIVKPISGSGSAGLVYLDSNMKTDWLQHWRRYGALLLQKRISPLGRGLGVSALFDQNSQCLAVFAHGRLQEYPNSGGPSTARISISDEGLVEKSLQLLRALNWRGVAMVEWKEDVEDGVPKLMEINPRFWGSLELAVRAGVDFPRLYAMAAAGEPVAPIDQYDIGVVCRWMFPGEILRYLTQEKSKREKFGHFFSGLPGHAEEWDARDLRGSLSALMCPLISAANPKYWKYLRR